MERLCRALLLLPLAWAALSCVKVDDTLGEQFIPTNRKYDVYHADFKLNDVRMKMADSLSGYSSRRITVGVVKDALLGTTRWSSAFSLVPFLDTLDLGKEGTRTIRQFHFSAVLDSVSVRGTGDESLLQNLRVRALKEALDTSFIDINSTVETLPGSICIGTPVLYGQDSLSFDFTEAFAARYLEILSEDLDSVHTFTKKFPGILLDIPGEPVTEGGRINMFGLGLQLSSSYQVTGNYAELKIRAEYDGEMKDTSFFFFFGPTAFIEKPTSLPAQYACNLTAHESRPMEGNATSSLLVEGGGGLKPVISSKELRDRVREDIFARLDAAGRPRSDLSKVIVNKATICLPYTFPDDWLEMKRFPRYLTPTCRIRRSEDRVTYAGLTDASISTENQGTIDRSNNRYAPDITHHFQEILKLEDDADFSRYDVWMLVMADETTTTTSDNSELSDYYTALAYNSYYNDMYGGYGGYGYGGYGYNNYYNYMMMAMAAGNSTSTSVSRDLDRDRFYRGVLNGTGAAKNAPSFSVTYSLPRE